MADEPILTRIIRYGYRGPTGPSGANGNTDIGLGTALQVLITNGSATDTAWASSLSLVDLGLSGFLTWGPIVDAASEGLIRVPIGADDVVTQILASRNHAGDGNFSLISTVYESGAGQTYAVYGSSDLGVYVALRDDGTFFVKTETTDAGDSAAPVILTKNFIAVGSDLADGLPLLIGSGSVQLKIGSGPPGDNSEANGSWYANKTAANPSEFLYGRIGGVWTPIGGDSFTKGTRTFGGGYDPLALVPSDDTVNAIGFRRGLAPLSYGYHFGAEKQIGDNIPIDLRFQGQDASDTATTDACKVGGDAFFLSGGGQGGDATLDGTAYFGTLNGGKLKIDPTGLQELRQVNRQYWSPGSIGGVAEYKALFENQFSDTSADQVIGTIDGLSTSVTLGDLIVEIVGGKALGTGSAAGTYAKIQTRYTYDGSLIELGTADGRVIDSEGASFSPKLVPNGTGFDIKVTPSWNDSTWIAKAVLLITRGTG